MYYKCFLGVEYFLKYVFRLTNVYLMYEVLLNLSGALCELLCIQDFSLVMYIHCDIKFGAYIYLDVSFIIKPICSA